jgi:3-methyladenine DNA glycosylase/8-oxoguanine DNA glycosylase
MALPVLTPEQRADALAKAAAARAARSAAKAALAAGKLSLADVLADGESPLQRARVREVLTAMPGIGDKTAGKLLDAAGISPSRRIQGLGVNQRRVLAALA